MATPSLPWEGLSQHCWLRGTRVRPRLQSHASSSFEHLPSMRLRSSQRLFKCPFVSLLWATQSPAARGQAWKESCSVIIQTTSCPRTTHSSRSPPPLFMRALARLLGHPLAEHRHVRMPGHPRAAGPSVTHTRVTLSGSRGRTVAITRINPGIRGWERSHQPTPAPRAALPVTATSSSKGMRGGGCASWGSDLLPSVPRSFHLNSPQAPSSHARITTPLPNSQRQGLGWQLEPPQHPPKHNTQSWPWTAAASPHNALPIQTLAAAVLAQPATPAQQTQPPAACWELQAPSSERWRFSQDSAAQWLRKIRCCR